MAKAPRHRWPVRLLHWCYAPAVLAGIWSGLYIHKPSRSLGFKSMDQARLTHSAAQYVLLSAFAARIYYGYVSGDWRGMIFDRKTLAGTPGFMRYELYLSKKKPQFPKYNPGQKALFTSLMVLVPLQLLTGFGLYAPQTFPKIADLAGGENRLRQWHYLLFLSISSMISGHIYLAVSESLRKLKSIFTGYK